MLTRTYLSNTRTQCGWGLVPDTQMESPTHDSADHPCPQRPNQRAIHSEINALKVKLQAIEAEPTNPSNPK